ncbi:MAG: phenylalanine--tRNA ligase subunit beta [Verrucomicrobia bacterium]|nr:phenylalanine--tRNA ligase subunit beta [Verrucomicrobiota bacterium]
MKIPYSWLKEFVDVEATPEELAERLTFSGVEVEGIHRLGDGLGDLIVGEIVRFEKHPAADRLRLCTVHDGRGELQVVCGASNFEVGDKAAFAPVGATLPGGMAITKRKVRGIESHGMLCAEDELGLSEGHGGILLVEREVPAGQSLATALGLPEVVFELEITWNRPDCLSVIGMAREVAALYGKSLRLPDVAYAEDSRAAADLAKVRIDDAARCPRYTGRVLSGLAVGPSPGWMQHRLKFCGVRPISNIVDVTNYVMLECGQPLHAFDLTRVAGAQIHIRCAQAGEKLKTLDGVERALAPDMLVIADAQEPLAVAGIMGGGGSEISESTREVLLESASFDAPGTRRTSVALGLASESSHRFERGVDPELADWASRRAAALLLQTAGGAAAGGVIDVYPGRAELRRITCRFARVQALLGVAIAADAICNIFAGLELIVESRTDAACVVRIPSFRRDLEIEADLIEEVARMHGLDRVPEATPHATLIQNVDDARTWAVMQLRERLTGLGLREILNYSFMSERHVNQLGGEDAARRLVIPNPVSIDHAVMRPALLPQMLLTLGHNMSRQVANADFFEIGRIFWRDEAGQACEAERLSLGLMGRVGQGALDGRRSVSPAEMFLSLKGLLTALCRAQSDAGLRMAPATHASMEPGWCVGLWLGDVALGTAGLLRRGLREEWRIAEPVGVAELHVQPLLAAPRRRSFAPLATYPSITHDVAMIVAEDVQHENILAVIRKAGPTELTDVRLFDIFRGVAVGVGRKSMAYSLVYQSGARTLTDAEANTFDVGIRQALRQELQAEIREG